eukprot:TRINITY_DN49079_c0_g1_i1.p1 TRINITY_DN49079_c0_g1~~TRINITY_DN49079_c0_g1_i1.p1  ORF type:complete len:1036 (-),score=159.16 TRINITY_DN49079_c0_g1_i1:59-3094(-)
MPAPICQFPLPMEVVEGGTVAYPSCPAEGQLAQPEKTALRLDLDAEAVSQLSVRAKEGLEIIQAEINDSGLIWSWLTFPVELPPSVIAAHGSAVSLGDLFQGSARRQSPEELQRLRSSQLASVRKNGTFEAESGVDGLPNVWMLSRVLVVGTQVLKQKRCQIFATAFGLQRYSWCRLFYGGSISILGGVLRMANGVGVLVDLLFGWRWMQNMHSDRDIEEAMQKVLWQKVLAGLHGGGSGRLPGWQEDDFRLPATWKLTDHVGVVRSLDLSFALDDTIYQIHEFLRPKLQEAEKELQRRRRGEGRQAEPWLPMQLEQLQLAALPSVLSPLLVATSTVSAAHSALRRQEEEMRKTAHADIEATYPVRKLCSEWREREIQRRVDTWRRTTQRADIPFELKAEAIALDRLRAHESGAELGWWIHILSQKIQFLMSSECSRMRVHMKAKLLPQKVMKFNFIIWRPKNWIITKHESKHRTWYEAERVRTYDVSTKMPGWRLWVLCVVVLEAANNGCYYLLANLVYGPLGLKAFCNPTAFYPGTKVDEKTGALRPDMDIKIETMFSRLAALWSGISKSRTRFESKPDTGLLGKSITRPFNLVWNYLFLGFVGTTLLLVMQPVLTLLNIPLCILLFLTPVFWAPILSLLAYVVCIILFDVFMSPACSCHVFGLLQGLWFVGVGCVEAVLSVAFVLTLPLINILVVILRIFHNLTWAVYDALMFCLIVRRKARVPADDSFIARRIAGPGLSADFHFQVSPAVALAALQQHLELTELGLRKQHLLRLAREPLRDFSSALKLYILAPFGLADTALSDKAVIEHVQKKLQRQQEQNILNINTTFEDRLRRIQRFLPCSPCNRHSIRLSRADLSRTMEAGARVVKAFAEARWLPLLQETERREFWETNDLTENDWLGLTRNLFGQAFSFEFADMPLEDMDASGFCLEVNHVGLAELVDAVVAADSSCKDPLTQVSPQCPRVAASSEISPDIGLADILKAEPSVPLWALIAVYREEEGWGLRTE